MCLSVFLCRLGFDFDMVVWIVVMSSVGLYASLFVEFRLLLAIALGLRVGLVIWCLRLLLLDLCGLCWLRFLGGWFG